jgi:O-antigen/teichoic acid export membrane protein/predicted O-methyltransferase YrrM
MSVKTKRTQVATNVLSNVAGYILPVSIFLITTPYILHKLGVVQNGIWLLSNSLVGYFAVYRIGMSEAIVKYLCDATLKKSTIEQNRFFSASLFLLLSLLLGQLGLVIAVVAPNAAMWFKIDEASRDLLENVIVLTSVGLIPTVMGIPFSAVLASLQRYDILNFITVVNSLLSVALTCLLLYLGRDLLAIVTVSVLLAAMFLLIHVAVAKFMVPDLSLLPAWNVAAFRIIGRFTFYSTATSFFAAATSFLDRILIGLFIGPGAVTYYSIPVGIARRLWELSSAVSQILTPMAAEACKSTNPEKLKHLFVISNRILSVILVASTAGAIYAGPAFLSLWLGPQFGQVAGSILRVQILLLAIVAACAPSYYILNGIGRPEVNTRGVAAGSILMGLLMCILIPAAGILGAALGLLGFSAGMISIPWAFLKEYFRPHPWRAALKIWGLPVGSWVVILLALAFLSEESPQLPTGLSMIMFVLGPPLFVLIICTIGEIIMGDRIFANVCFRVLNSPGRTLLNPQIRTFVKPLWQWVTRARLKKEFPETWEWVFRSRQIQGWLSDSEADQLFKLARYSTPACQPVVVELGSWKGKSSVMLAAGLVGKERPRLYCIDPFGCDEKPEYQKKYYDPLIAADNQPVEEVFKQNVKSYGVDSIAIPLKGYSFDFGNTWLEPIDLLFIDANHEFDAVSRDFKTWQGLVKSGGVIAIHDANGAWPGPTRVVAQMAERPDYGPIHTVGTLAWAVKQSNKNGVLVPSLNQ